MLARIDEARTCTQSLSEHIHSVAQITSASCRSVGLEALGELTGLLHDSGKAYTAWQNYLLDCSSTKETVPHSGPGVWFAQRLFGGRSEDGAELTLQMLCLAIRGHHGGLHDVLTPDGNPDEPLHPDYSQSENEQAEQDFFNEIVSKERLEFLFTQACAEVRGLFKKALAIASEKSENRKKEFQNELMIYLSLSQRFLYSALIDGDRTDAAEWERSHARMETCTFSEPEYAIPDWQALSEKLDEKLRQFDRCGINALRADICESCKNFVSDNCGIYRLYVPTGGGKTLSGLAFAINTAKHLEKNKIFIITPYLTILEQNADAVRDAIGEDKSTLDSSVLQHASNVVFEENEEGEVREIIHERQSERWHSPEIIMTTSVQFLNSLFSGNGAATRRMHALANSVIVFDEVQTVPSECIFLFNLALNFLAKFCHCVIVLCTATPPALSALTYPVRMSTPEDIVPNTDELFCAFKRTELVFDGYQHGMEIDELAEFIISKYQQNGNCLAIMNTKSIALRLYKKISESVYSGVRVYYLSTELCPAHRTEIIKKIRGLLDSGQPVVCVSTQLIEAGVDISFNCVVRALAGLDSIIQAAGRCNRHGNSALQNVFVVNCVGERLDMLPDILSGRQSTIKLLADFEREPEKLGGSLLSPTAICKYYGYYFFDREKNLGYSLDKHNTAVNLLGFSEKARTAFQNEYGSVFRHSLLAQAFRTVGKSFTPIAQNTTGVIIPFTGCDEELQKLFAANNFKEKSRYYRRLQKFMVNVYENRLTELMESRAIVFDEKYGIWILDKNFYSSETGISISEADKTDNYIL